MESKNILQIGIYAGTFNPVHSGHISFALDALQSVGLDEVYFLPERMPTDDVPAEHYGHRVAMLRRALLPHNNLEIAETADKRFSVTGTLPRLRRVVGDSALVFLMGADTFVSLLDLPNKELLIDSCAFVVSTRNKQEVATVLAVAADLAVASSALTLLDSPRPDVATQRVREALREQRDAPGLLPSVARYARDEWLYVSIPL